MAESTVCNIHRQLIGTNKHLHGVKYLTVTQDTSPGGVAEVWDKYLFGLVTDKKRKKTKEKKNGY